MNQGDPLLTDDEMKDAHTVSWDYPREINLPMVLVAQHQKTRKAEMNNFIKWMEELGEKNGEDMPIDVIMKFAIKRFKEDFGLEVTGHVI